MFFLRTIFRLGSTRVLIYKFDMDTPYPDPIRPICTAWVISKKFLVGYRLLMSYCCFVNPFMFLILIFQLKLWNVSGTNASFNFFFTYENSFYYYSILFNCVIFVKVNFLFFSYWNIVFFSFPFIICFNEK